MASIGVIPVAVSGRRLETGGIRFEGGLPALSGETVPFSEAKRLAYLPGSRGRVMVVDVSGMGGGMINSTLLKDLKVRGNDVWFMSAISRIDDVLDGFNTYAEMLAIPYHLTESTRMLEDAVSISDSCIPAVFVRRGEAYGRGGMTGLREAAYEILDLGFRTAIVADLDSSLDDTDWNRILEMIPSAVPYAPGRPDSAERFTGMGFRDVLTDVLPAERRF
ncbi:MAG: hypothetical protein RBQ77_05810 [Candidatus Methanomethylophilaceae archaeon]|jgi:hypothetical protein|nr:hypothetical protein [Candidatus Methanomethylophilaceae archaeon]